MLKRFSLLVLLMLCSTVVLAQYDHPQKKGRSKHGSRDGRFEASVILAMQSGVDKSSENGSSLDVDSSTGWGISVGWNWTAKLNLQYRLLVNKPKYLAIVIPEDPDQPVLPVDHKMSKLSHQLNFTYNFLDGNITPYLAGGIGWTKIDSNVPNGSVSGGCWWDPWWGYVCWSDWKTYTASKFTYNLGAGVRWDINNFVYSKAAYTREFLDVKSGSLDFDTITLEVGLMF
jgi:opacity protein-like surface antigen